MFTVRDETVAAESIEIFANNLTPLAGQSVVISKNVKPANTTDKIEWKILEGADYASMAGDALVVLSNAKAGDVIRIQAIAGNNESNVLEFTVASTEVPATKITISADSYNLIKGSAITVKSTIVPSNSTDDITLIITSGNEYASIVGNVLVVSQNAPAGTVIKVVAKAGKALFYNHNYGK